MTGGLALLFAVPSCWTEADLESTGSTVRADTGEPVYTYEVEPLEPEWTADEAAARILEALVDGIPSCVDFVERYLRVLGNGDEQCPETGGAVHAMFNVVPCVTQTGWTFGGIGSASLECNGQTEETTCHYSLVSDFAIVNDEGAQYVAGGGCFLEMFLGDAVATFDGELNATQRIEFADDYFVDGVSAWIFNQGELVTETGRLTLDLEGGVTVHGTSIIFTDYAWGSDACPAQSSGTVSVRGDEHWYVFDFGTRCDGCAGVVYGGQVELGEACLDLEAVMFAHSDRVLNAPVTQTVKQSNKGADGQKDG